MSNPKTAELSETELDNVTGGCNPYYQPCFPWQPKKAEYCAPKQECHPKEECHPYYPTEIARPV